MAILLKEKHENEGRSYPRPRSICDECEGSLVLCWGTIHEKPYFRHIISNNGSCKGGGGEGAFHYVSKELLCSYLNKGGRLEYSTRCEQCSRTTNSLLPFNGEYQWKTEVTYSTIRFDIAALLNDKVKVGIEVYAFHRTLSNKERDNIPWIEVDYKEILSSLDVAISPLKITLKNIQRVPTCSLPYCLPLNELAKQLGYYSNDNKWQLKCKTWNDVLWQSFLVRNQCIKCSLPWKTSKGKCYCISCYYTVQQSSRINEEQEKGENRKDELLNLDQLSLEDIGKELGYLPQEENNLNGKNRQWRLIPPLKESSYLKQSALWNILRNIGRCIRCEKRYNVSRGKPYCLSCYKEIRNRNK